MISAIGNETKSTSFGNWKPYSAEPKEPNPKPKVRKTENQDNCMTKLTKVTEIDSQLTQELEEKGERLNKTD